MRVAVGQQVDHLVAQVESVAQAAVATVEMSIQVLMELLAQQTLAVAVAEIISLQQAG
jgi:hypothetical protein